MLTNLIGKMAHLQPNDKAEYHLVEIVAVYVAKFGGVERINFVVRRKDNGLIIDLNPDQTKLLIVE